MIEAQKEIEEILKKHNCHLEVDFIKEVVMGSTVLVYKIILVENEKK